MILLNITNVASERHDKDELTKEVRTNYVCGPHGRACAKTRQADWDRLQYTVDKGGEGIERLTANSCRWQLIEWQGSPPTTSLHLRLLPHIGVAAIKHVMQQPILVFWRSDSLSVRRTRSLRYWMSTKCSQVAKFIRSFFLLLSREVSLLRS